MGLPWKVAPRYQRRCFLTQEEKLTNVLLRTIIPLCKHVVAKVTLVPRSVNLTGKRDKVGHGEVTINSVRIISFDFYFHLNMC